MDKMREMVGIQSFVSGCDNRVVVNSDNAILGRRGEQVHRDSSSRGVSSSREGSYMSAYRMEEMLSFGRMAHDGRKKWRSKNAR